MSTSWSLCVHVCVRACVCVCARRVCAAIVHDNICARSVLCSASTGLFDNILSHFLKLHISPNSPVLLLGGFSAGPWRVCVTCHRWGADGWQHEDDRSLTTLSFTPPLWAWGRGSGTTLDWKPEAESLVILRAFFWGFKNPYLHVTVIFVLP